MLDTIFNVNWETTPVLIIMEKIEGKNGEQVTVSASYRCAEHPESWFSFNKNEIFRLCPRCNAEHKTANTWYSIIDDNKIINPKSRHTFWSTIKSFFPL